MKSMERVSSFLVLLLALLMPVSQLAEAAPRVEPKGLQTLAEVVERYRRALDDRYNIYGNLTRDEADFMTKRLEEYFGLLQTHRRNLAKMRDAGSSRYTRSDFRNADEIAANDAKIAQQTLDGFTANAARRVRHVGRINAAAIPLGAAAEKDARAPTSVHERLGMKPLRDATGGADAQGSKGSKAQLVP